MFDRIGKLVENSVYAVDRITHDIIVAPVKAFKIIKGIITETAVSTGNGTTIKAVKQDISEEREFFKNVFRK